MRIIKRLHDVKGKLIFLTFDDGPDPINTRPLLDVLNLHDVRATFFCTGIRAEKFPDYLLLLKENDHDIANHGYTHRDLRFCQSKVIADEISRTDRVIAEVTGEIPLFFRPPFLRVPILFFLGKPNLRKITVLCSRNGRDYQRDATADNIYSRILPGITPGDIILLHDGGEDRSETIKTLSRIIPELEADGWKFSLLREHLSIPSPE